ncbi:hypothetical protein A5722_01525 [Mycobacterium vulneris]|uniref:Uncharacterized protein n=2 Tax=Mycolicibacterium TaxID=1866885 RepID=A0A7X6MUA1_9MYCO|nr:hypothetical protein [Mycolicibacterium septicum]OBK01913.1 hypothetical protein A5637_18425 [Mycolicibacterium fortuitum]OCB48670.1 hypothetical protein A5721_04795 [Mycolicibacterium vulneris]NKZ15017.1 hypothetical protein [Mycolicibacterium septicum DSM 44393]OBK63326.1 hypothetical protein A5654_24365 [Mycolicibacterium fortuitum]OCB51487.1 hypothetical protein A5722_01525 [Mycolicibacterium vulneris]
MKVLKATLALAGVAAVALYVAVMLLIELLARLLPLIVLGAVVMLAVYVWRRVQAHHRERHQAAIKDRAPTGTVEHPAQRQVSVVPALPSHQQTRLIVGSEGNGGIDQEGYLRLGPPPALPSSARQSDVVAAGRSHGRRNVSHARPRSSRP